MIYRNVEAEIHFTVHDFVTLVMEHGYKHMLDEVVGELNERNYTFTDAEKEAMARLHDEWEM